MILVAIGDHLLSDLQIITASLSFCGLWVSNRQHYILNENSLSQCLDWTWYLANDMQLYLISPVIIFVFY